MPVFCDVVIPRTRLDELTYAWEPEEFGQLKPGDCVTVPLRSRVLAGIIVASRETSPVKNVQMVRSRQRPGLLTAEMLGLMRWVSGYYCARLGEVLGQLLPRRVERYEVSPSPEVPPAAREAAARGLEVDEALFAALAGRRFGVWVSRMEQRRCEWTAEIISAGLAHGSMLLLLPAAKLASWLPLLRTRFERELIEYHAGMSEQRLRSAWLRIRWSEHRLIVGVRAAVLAPVADLAGVIVVDEHDAGYKEERQPRFHARDVAVFRGRQSACPVILLDRTPSLETWYNLQQGRYRSLEVPKDAGRPRVNAFVVDMRLHRGELFSDRLRRDLERVRDDGGSAVLYINRRGLSRHVACRSCGLVLACPECGVPLMLSRGRTECGYCGRQETAPDRCPECGSGDFEFAAPGVEMFAAELCRLLGEVRVNEVVSEPATEQLSTGSFHVGTRALFSRQWPPDTGLVAALNADAGIAVHDFRSRERLFQSLYELCVRAGELNAGVVVQTRRPLDTAISAAVEGQYPEFAAAELRQRRDAGFPPYVRLALIMLAARAQAGARLKRGEESRASAEHGESGPETADRLLRYAGALKRRLERSGADVLGPAKERGRTVVRLLVKLPRGLKLVDIIRAADLERSGLRVRVDVDPMGFGEV